MQVPKRKAEKFTNIAVDPYVTQEKFDELKFKLDKMLKSRPALASDVKTYAANGDFSENAEYQIAKARLRGLNQRILDTEDHLRKAKIIKFNSKSEVISIGNTITVEVNGEQKIYQILGSSETKPEKGIISHNSPIGLALLGKRVGDSVKISIAKGEITYFIISIS